MITQKIDIIKRARELISDEHRWLKSRYATDKDNKTVSPESENACFWCPIGAVYKAAAEMGVTDNFSGLVFTHNVMNVLSSVIDNKQVSYYNDEQDTEHSDIMKMFDDAHDLLASEVICDK